jgi:hypothetical protein
VEEVRDALLELKRSIDEQRELQEMANARMSALTEMMAHLIEALQEFREKRPT